MAAATAKTRPAKTAATSKSKRAIPCKVAGCKRPYRAKGYCVTHYRKWRRGELEASPRYKICKEENCRKPIYRKGYCEQHYSAWSASKKGEQAKPAGAPAASAEAATA